MTQHRPIVLRNGRLTELPAGDAVAGLDLSTLPPATDQPPQAIIVRQGGQWVIATYAQMQAWLPGDGGVLPVGTVTVGGVPVRANGQNVTVT